MTAVADEAVASPVRHKARRAWSFRQWATGAAVLAFSAYLAYVFATNHNMRWDAVWKFMFNPQVTLGVIGTIELTVLGQALAIALGFVIALLQQSRSPVSSAFAGVYVWLFRAVPLLVQLLVWFNIGLVLPYIDVSIPGTDFGIFVSTNELISGFTAAILGLGLHEAAYMAEIIRAGIISVPQGQMDAALS